LRIAVLSAESRLSASLWGIALSLQFALPAYSTRERENRSDTKVQK
jgi:hypothetical protein